MTDKQQPSDEELIHLRQTIRFLIAMSVRHGDRQGRLTVRLKTPLGGLYQVNIFPLTPSPTEEWETRVIPVQFSRN